ncbi:MAG: HIT family protein [Bacteriovoracaceae bacterium]|jgi:histidine triad (HIT) family protein|nr:HIT family protein [Bacteriovoracaceae bacterium]
MSDNDENSKDKGLDLDDVLGSDKEIPSEIAGSGKSAQFDLDDIDIDEELEIDSGASSDMGMDMDMDMDIDIEFGTGEIEVQGKDPVEKHVEMPVAISDAKEDSSAIDLSTGGNKNLTIEAASGGAIDQDKSMEMQLSEEDDDATYEAAPDNDGDLDLSSDELFEQSQTSIKTGGAAKKMKTPEVKIPTANAPKKNVKPKETTIDHNPNCNFCKIALKRFKLMTIYEDDDLIAIMDPKPLMKGQVLLCSKTHKSSLSNLTAEENAHFFNVAKLISDGIKKSKIPADGVSYFLSESVNEKEDLKHIYMSLIPRKPQDGIGLKFSKKNTASVDDLELIGDHLIDFLS